MHCSRMTGGQINMNEICACQDVTPGNLWTAQGTQEGENMRMRPLCRENETGRKEHSTPRDAIEWYVEIDARPKADDIMQARCKRWMVNRLNRLQYAEAAWMGCELRVMLPPPSLAKRAELLADVAAEAAFLSK
jgi:hypothetical protein